MKTNYVYYNSNGERRRLTKEDIIFGLCRVAIPFYDVYYLYRLKRWNYDHARSALCYFLKKKYPELLQHYENLYDVYVHYRS